MTSNNSSALRAHRCVTSSAFLKAVSALCRGPLSTGDAYLQGQQALYKAGLGHGGLLGAHDFHTFPSIALNKHFIGHNPFSMAQAFPEVRALLANDKLPATIALHSQG